MMWPWSHFCSVLLMFLIKTGSFVTKVLVEVEVAWLIFWANCLFSTLAEYQFSLSLTCSVFFWSTIDLMEIRLLQTVVLYYMQRTFGNFVFIVFPVTFLKPFFTICTTRSPRPLLVRWWGAEVMLYNYVFYWCKYPLRKQVDIIAKSQVLQILYLKHNVYNSA